MARNHRYLALMLALSSLKATSHLLPRQDPSSTSDRSGTITDIPTVPSRPTIPKTQTSSFSTPSAISPSAFSNEPLNSTNDPSNCHKTLTISSSSNIFCRPPENANLTYGSDYILQWDPSHAPNARLNPPQIPLYLEIYRADYYSTTEDFYPEKREHAVYAAQGIYSNGETVITTQKGWLKDGKNAVNLTIVLTTTFSAGPAGVQTRLGPTVLLTNVAGDKGTASPGVNDSDDNGSGGRDKQIGEKVGIPIGLIFFLAFVGTAAFILLRRRKRRTGDYLSSRKRRITGPSSGLVGPFQGTRKRGESFHDEATFGSGGSNSGWAGGRGSSNEWADGRGGGGMELQDRNSGVSRWSRVSSMSGHSAAVNGSGSWDWGWGGSPTSPEDGGGGNVFREEIGRQRTGRGY